MKIIANRIIATNDLYSQIIAGGVIKTTYFITIVLQVPADDRLFELEGIVQDTFAEKCRLLQTITQLSREDAQLYIQQE